MPIKVQEPLLHFKAYYQDNSLLIRLMLQELSRIYQHIPPLRRLKKLEVTNQEEYLQHLHPCLIAFIGETNKNNFGFTGDVRKGPLVRLKEYWEQFFHNERYSQSQHHLKMTKQMERIWLNVIHLLQLIQEWQTCAVSHKAQTYFLKIQRKVQTLLSTTDNMAHLFLVFLKQFNDDENVIFFLLRKKGVLFTIYGSEKTNKLLKGLSKNQNLMHLLINRFKARGFDHLLPTIKQELFLYEPYKNKQN